jgi:caspase domain-containing protein/Sel1 repeat-containing protein
MNSLDNPPDCLSQGLAMLLAAGAAFALCGNVARSGVPMDPNRLLIVDCLLPGVVRQLGNHVTYITPRRPVKSTVDECEIRGGEYVKFDRANFSTALQVWKESASAGDAQAQVYVGEIYEKGLGLPPDYGQAAVWYQKAADQGYARGLSNLAYLYEQGLGVPKDPVKALNLYRKSAGINNDELTFASEVTAAKAEAASEIATLTQQLTVSDQQLLDLQAQLAQAKADAAARRTALSVSRQEAENLRGRLKELQAAGGGAESADKAAEIKRLQGEIAARETRIAQQQTEAQALESANTAKAAELSQGLQQAAAENEKLLAQLGSRASDDDKLRADAAAAKARMESMDTQIRQLRTQLNSARFAMADEQAKVARQSTAATATTAATNEELTRLKQKLAAADARVSQQEALIAQMQTQRAVAQQDIDRFKAQAAAGQSANARQAQADLAAAGARMESMNTQILQLQAQLKSEREEQAKAARQSTAATAATGEELTRLKQKLAAADARVSQQEALIAQVQTQRAAAQQDIDRYKAQAAAAGQSANARQAQADLASANARMASMNERILKLQAQLESQRAAAAAERASMAQRSAADAALTADELNRLKRKAADSEARVAQQEATVAALQSQRVAAQKETDRLEAQQALADQRQKQQSSDGDALRAQLAIAQQRLLQSQQQLADTSAKAEEEKKRIEADSVSLQRRREMASAQELVEIRKLTADLAQRDAKLIEQRSMIAALEAESRSYSDEVMHLKAANVSPPPPPNPNPRPPVFASQQELDLGGYYALIIGNNLYQNMPNLESAVNDARGIERVLKDRYGFKTRLLLNATRADILGALNEFRQSLGEKDSLLIYYAGHGEIDERKLVGYWLPVNAKRDDTTEWISDAMITGQIEQMTARHVLVVADSCYSGAMTRSSGVRLIATSAQSGEMKRLIRLAKLRSRTVLTSGGVAPVLDGGAGANSIFARSLIDVLSSNKSVLEASSLYNQVFDPVRRAAARFKVDESPRYSELADADHRNGDFLLIPAG